MKILVLSLFLFLTAAVSAQTNVIVTAEEANVRAKPSLKSTIITTVQSGENLKVLGKAGVWRKVQTDNGVGWLHRSTVAEVGTMIIGNEDVPVIKTTLTQKITSSPSRSGPSRTYIRGPRGGCYYINSNGNKTYVDRSLCN